MTDPADYYEAILDIEKTIENTYACTVTYSIVRDLYNTNSESRRYRARLEDFHRRYCK